MDYVDIKENLQRLVKTNGFSIISIGDHYVQLLNDLGKQQLSFEAVSSVFLPSVGNKDKEFKQLSFVSDPNGNYNKLISHADFSVNLTVQEIETIFETIYHVNFSSYKIESHFEDVPTAQPIHTKQTASNTERIELPPLTTREIVLIDHELREVAKEWAIVNDFLIANPYSKTSTWEKIKMLFGIPVPYKTEHLNQCKETLERLDKIIVHYYFEKLPKLSKNKTTLTEVQKKYFEELYRMARIILDLITFTKNINQCIITEYEHGLEYRAPGEKLSTKEWRLAWVLQYEKAYKEFTTSMPEINEARKPFYNSLK